MSVHICRLDGACPSPPPPHPGAVIIPIRLPDDEDDEAGVEESLHRYDDCVGYDACLDHAACIGYDSWSCHDCPVFEAVEFEPLDVTRLISASEIDHPMGE